MTTAHARFIWRRYALGNQVFIFRALGPSCRARKRMQPLDFNSFVATCSFAVLKAKLLRICHNQTASVKSEGGNPSGQRNGRLNGGQRDRAPTSRSHRDRHARSNSAAPGLGAEASAELPDQLAPARLALPMAPIQTHARCSKNHPSRALANAPRNGGGIAGLSPAFPAHLWISLGALTCLPIWQMPSAAATDTSSMPQITTLQTC